MFKVQFYNLNLMEELLKIINYLGRSIAWKNLKKNKNI